MAPLPQTRDALSGDSTLIELPERCGTADAAALHRQLVEAADAGKPILIDASAVEFAGQATLQLLVAARREADAIGQAVEIVAGSAAFADQVERCALSADLQFEAGA